MQATTVPRLTRRVSPLSNRMSRLRSFGTTTVAQVWSSRLGMPTPRRYASRTRSPGAMIQSSATARWRAGLPVIGLMVVLPAKIGQLRPLAVGQPDRSIPVNLNRR